MFGYGFIIVRELVPASSFACFSATEVSRFGSPAPHRKHAPNYKDNQRQKREISNDFTSFHIILALSNYALRFKQKIAQREIPAIPDGLHNPAKSFPKSGSRDRSFVVNTG
ncbi:hypothetical protein LCM19_13255 [Qipengyuania flava]|nr:hypothetical protein [Qipengyuania flava]